MSYEYHSPHQSYNQPGGARLDPATERTGGALVHGGVLAATVFSAGTLGFLGALVVWLIYRDRGPLLRNAAANALNIQLNALIWLIVSVVLMFVLIGFLTYPLVIVWACVLHVVGLTKVNSGEFWRAPLWIPFFSTRS